MKRKINIEKLEKIGKIGLVALTFVFCFCIAFGTARETAPDEGMKYQIADYIMKNLSLPDGRDVTIRDSLWGISYAFSPYLSYIFSGFLMRFASIFTSDANILFSVARLPDVIFITLFVLFCIKIGDQIFINKKYKWLFFILSAFWPQVIFIGGYINNDSLALLSTAIIIYGWILGLKNNWNTKSLIFLGVGVGLCSLSYYNAYGFILLSVVLFLWSALSKKMNLKKILSKGAIVAGIAVLIGGWFFVRNAIIYDGDFLGLKTETEMGNLYAVDELKPDNRPTYQHIGRSPLSMLAGTKWIAVTIKSFIGLFGRMSVPLATPAYFYYLGILGVGVLGCIFAVIKARSDKIHKLKSSVYLEGFSKLSSKDTKIIFIVFVLAIIIPVLLSIYYSYASDYQPQGRYIIPMIIPLIIFIVLGIENIINSLIVKEMTKKIVVGALSIICLIMPIYYVFFLIIPALS